MAAITPPVAAPAPAPICVFLLRPVRSSTASQPAKVMKGSAPTASTIAPVLKGWYIFISSQIGLLERKRRCDACRPRATRAQPGTAQPGHPAALIQLQRTGYHGG